MLACRPPWCWLAEADRTRGRRVTSWRAEVIVGNGRATEAMSHRTGPDGHSVETSVADGRPRRGDRGPRRAPDRGPSVERRPADRAFSGPCARTSAPSAWLMAFRPGV